MNDLGFELLVVYRPASRREIVERNGVAEECYENAFDSVLCRKHQTSFFTRLDRSTSSRSFATCRLPCGTGFSEGQRTLEEGTTLFTTRFIACHLGCFEDSYEERNRNRWPSTCADASSTRNLWQLCAVPRTPSVSVIWRAT